MNHKPQKVTHKTTKITQKTMKNIIQKNIKID